MASNVRPERTERLQLVLNADEVVALDDWRFRERMPGRSAAARELLRRGLAAEGYLAGDHEGRRSGGFGVIHDGSAR